MSRAYQPYTPGREPCFEYLLSGGDGALVASDELPEDDPDLGRNQVEALLADLGEGDPVVVVGISCGLSAPYVAGMLEFAMRDPRCTAVAVGFNPVEWARDAPVEGWDQTCRDIYRKLAAASRDGDPQARYPLPPHTSPHILSHGALCDLWPPARRWW